MAVYTEVSFDEAAALIARLSIGELKALQPISSGIENTNYFADTAQGRYVLTLFERLTHTQLPFYLQLMKHLAERGIPVPRPHGDARGEILHTLKGKPAAVVDRLRGRHHLAPGLLGEHEERRVDGRGDHHPAPGLRHGLEHGAHAREHVDALPDGGVGGRAAGAGAGRAPAR